MRQLRAAASFAPPPPVSRPSIPPPGPTRHPKSSFGLRANFAPPRQFRAPSFRPGISVKFHPAGSATHEGLAFASTPRRRRDGRCRRRPAPRPISAPQLRPPGPVSRRSFTGPAGQPPRLRVARQTLSPAAAHERDRAKFSPRTPANTGRPKLPPRKSPRPSPPCALMSADRRTWPQRRLARSRLEKSNGCKPATPDPPIAEAGAARITRPPQFLPHRSFCHIAVPQLDNRISPLRLNRLRPPKDSFGVCAKPRPADRPRRPLMHGGYDAPAMADPDPPIPVLEALIAAKVMG